MFVTRYSVWRQEQQQPAITAAFDENDATEDGEEDAREWEDDDESEEEK